MGIKIRRGSGNVFTDFGVRARRRGESPAPVRPDDSAAQAIDRASSNATDGGTVARRVATAY